MKLIKSNFNNVIDPQQYKQGNAAIIAIIITVIVLCCCVVVCCMLYGIVSWSAAVMNDSKAANQYEIKQDGGKNSANDNLKAPESENPEISSGEEARLPSNFPLDVPIYPNAELSYAGVQESVTSTIFGVEASPDAVIAYYEVELPANGWTVKEKVNFIVTGITAEKSNRELTVGVYGDETATTLTLTIN